jgi:hypothetical protein
MEAYVRDRRSVPRGSDRRQTRRIRADLEARLLLGISFLDADAGAEDAQPLDLFGRARDISAGGLGLVISAVNLDTRACAEARPFDVTIHLPRADVELRAESVHCAPLDPRRPEDGCLLGARIVESGEEDIGLLFSAQEGSSSP